MITKSFSFVLLISSLEHHDGSKAQTLRLYHTRTVIPFQSPALYQPRPVTSLGGHPVRAIEPDGLPVEHGVGDDGLDEHGELVRISEARRARDLAAELLLHLLTP